MVNKIELRTAMLAVDEAAANILTKPGSEVSILAASFLKTHQVLRILWRRVLSPVMLYVGFAAPDSIYFLTGNPEAFIKMSRADKVSLESPQQALEYFSLFLEVTRSMSQLFYQVNSVDEIKWRNNLKEPEIARMKIIKDKYQKSIVPQVKMVGHRYHVNCYAMQGVDLNEFEAFVTAGGTIELKSQILEKKLPSSYGA